MNPPQHHCPRLFSFPSCANGHPQTGTRRGFRRRFLRRSALRSWRFLSLFSCCSPRRRQMLLTGLRGEEERGAGGMPTSIRKRLSTGHLQMWRPSELSHQQWTPSPPRSCSSSSNYSSRLLRRFVLTSATGTIDTSARTIASSTSAFSSATPPTFQQNA